MINTKNTSRIKEHRDHRCTNVLAHNFIMRVKQR